MIVNNHIEQEDLALYAMHLLPELEAKAVASHLEECRGCGDLAALLRGDLAAMAVATEMHAPSPAARQRLMGQVAREKKIVPINQATHVEAGGPLASRLLVDDQFVPNPNPAAKVLPWVSWVGWAVAAGLTMTVVDLYRERDELRLAVAKQANEMQTLSADAEKGRAIVQMLTDRDAVRVTLNTSPAKAAPQARATYLPGKGSLLLIASNLEPLKPLKTYELWIIPANGHDPVPAGTFRPDLRGNASLIMPQIPTGVVAKAFGITIEDQGGSQKPTLPIVLSGA